MIMLLNCEDIVIYYAQALRPFGYLSVRAFGRGRSGTTALAENRYTVSARAIGCGASFRAGCRAGAAIIGSNALGNARGFRICM